jgi:pyruvate/2-oxoglutarate dehydrogenase complex dihydrolipoamide acyltransferase (E2) component
VGARDYEIIDFPKSRLATIDTGRLGLRNMYGLLEVDVTEARKRLRQLRRQGREVSFTAWMVKTIGDCIAAHRYVHAALFRTRKLVLFHDVDIAMPIEVLINDVPVPLPLLIKATNRKSAAEIAREIEAGVHRLIENERSYILSKHAFSRAALRLYYRLPSFLRIAALKWLTANPFRARRHSGTVTVTTVNAVGNASGWILPTRSWHNIFFALGAVTRKPWVVGKDIQIREILNLSVVFNHDVIDGVPARRFMQDLISHIERGAGL